MEVNNIYTEQVLKNKDEKEVGFDLEYMQGQSNLGKKKDVEEVEAEVPADDGKEGL